MRHKKIIEDNIKDEYIIKNMIGTLETYVELNIHEDITYQSEYRINELKEYKKSL